ncbi:hypothetical protein BCR34DRAFT_476112, partial [Clohesyomyces aquaticus]
YATERKPLRVTHTCSIHRSTYFLSLPYKYTVPLIAANTTLHWLISQSIFIVSITAFYPNFSSSLSVGMTFNTSIFRLPSLEAIIFGSAFVPTIFLVSWFKTLSGAIPLVSTCSAAISAVCYCPD